MYRGALRAIVSELARSGRLIVVDSIDMAEPKTRVMRELLGEWSANDALIIDADLEANVHLAARNLPHVTTTDVDGINPWLMLRHESVVVTAAALKKLEERLA
jgi:large subunit ribosomal protein L4